MAEVKQMTILDKSLSFIIILIAFLIPLSGKILVPLITIWIIIWLIRGNIKNKISNIKWSSVFLLPVFFYLLHIIGMSYTSNFSEGLFDLEVKFSLLLFPVLIVSDKEFFQKYRNNILSAFLIGNCMAALVCIGYGFFRTMKYDINYLLYTDFSLFHHTTYASMYALFSIIILIYFLFNKKPIPASYKLAAVFPIAILCAYIYFLSSRAGILTAIIVLAFLTIIYCLMKQKWILLISGLVIFVALPYIIIQNHPRFTPVVDFINTPLDSLKVDAPENITVRYIIACQTMELIKQNALLGTGTGDVKDELKKFYEQKKIVHALNPTLNTHNQFLETFIGLGILGILFLLLLVFYPLIVGFRTENILLITFSLIIISNFMFESMLNTQAGIIFFAFFYSLLSSIKASPKIN